MKNYKYNLLLLVIFAFGILLRILKISFSGPVSFDEAWSYWQGAKSITTLFNDIAVDKHPPLFYLLMHIWNMFYYSELWIRLPSLFASIMNMILFYLLSKKVFKSDSMILISFILFSLSSHQISYGSIARMYTLSTTFSLLGIYAFFQSMDKPGKKWSIINSIANLFFLMTHYIGVFSIIAQISFLSFNTFKKKYRKDLLINWILCHSPYLIIGIYFFPSFVSQLSAGGLAPAWIAVRIGRPSIFDGFFQAILGDLNSAYWLTYFGYTGHFLFICKFLLGICILGFVLMSLFSIDKLPRLKTIRNEPKLSFLIFFYLLPVSVFWLISQFEPIFVKRYFIPFQFAWYLILSFCCLNLLRGIIKFIFPIILAALLLTNIIIYTYAPYQESDWKKKSELIVQNWEKDDILLIVPIADIIRFKFYAGPNENIKFDKSLYRKIFKSKSNPVQTKDLEDVFLNKKNPYKRIWYHEEVNTGLSDEFILQEKGTIFNFFRNNYKINRQLSFQDKRGALTLFQLN